MTMVFRETARPQNAYSAFKTQLSTLCLDQFPCGMGSWRDSKIILPRKPNGKILIIDKDPVESKFSVTLKDYPVHTEKIDELEELVQSINSPWQLDYSWSGQARKLRETAVQSPWLVDEQYIHDAFKTLKIVNKDVTEIDANLLKFRNLEELTLSANYLTSVQSEHLPKKLQVLELCGNQIEELSGLCRRPPPLIHLGLGYNTLTCTDDYITGDIWPNLLSLDMSHNHLTDLFDFVFKLQTLPKLRNLFLLGNPLFFTPDEDNANIVENLLPGYRGYVVDSLRHLQILDDVRISADEKHNFKGLAKNRDFILEEVKVRLAVDFIKGLPVPDEIKNPDDQPEFPIITRKYFVVFMFPRAPPTSEVDICHVGEDAASVLTSARTTEGEAAVADQGDEGTKAVNELNAVREVARLQSRSQVNERASLKVSGVEVEEEGLVLEPLQSTELPYAEEVETNWAKILVRYNLTFMRDFMKQGMEIKVMEGKILSYPADQMTQPTDTKKDKKKDKKDDKGKGKDDEKKKDDKKKKKKDLDIELQHMPPEYTTIATFHIPLKDFLDGETKFDTVFSQGEPEGGWRTDVVDKTKKGKAKKPTSAEKKKDKKDHPKSPKGDKGKDTKGGKGKQDKQEKQAEEEEELPPPPLEVGVHVRLMRFQTASEAKKSVETPKASQTIVQPVSQVQ